MTYLVITIIVSLFLQKYKAQSTIINYSITPTSLTAEFLKNTNNYSFFNIQQSNTISYSNEQQAPYMIQKS